MPLPIIPFLWTLGAGAGLAAGSDLYQKGRALIEKHGPNALSGFEDVAAKITDVLDPLDISGAKARREKEALDSQRAEDAGRAKKREAALKKSGEKKLAEQERKQKEAADKRIREVEANAKRVLDNAVSAGAKALQSAKAEIARIKALRAAERAAARAPDNHPLQEVVAQVLATVAAGGHLPDSSVYTANAPEIDFQSEGMEFEASGSDPILEADAETAYWDTL